MFKLLNNLLFSPTDASGGDTAHPIGSQDILEELLKDDGPEVIDLDDNKTAKEVEDKEVDADKVIDKDVDEDKDKEVDELEELEKELKGPTEEQLQLMTPSRRKDILKDFPDLFKKHPYLETAYYRDQKFTELFSTIKDAEEAAESLKSFNDLEAKLKTGDIESVIVDIKKDEKTFNKMVDNYLPTLAKVSPDAYHHIVGNLIKYTVREMFTEANTKSNDSLKTAATILHDFIFGTTKWTPPTNLSQESSTQDSKAESDLAKREREFNERKFNSAQNDIASRVDNAIKATIDQHIDPSNQMTAFIKNAATERALKQVEELIGKDTRFKSLLDRLWQNAANKDFAKSEMDKIKSACISKTRTLLPSVIKMARHEALKGLGKKVKDEDEDTDTPAKGKSATPLSSGKSRSDKSALQPNESSLDFLMRD